MFIRTPPKRREKRMAIEEMSVAPPTLGATMPQMVERPPAATFVRSRMPRKMPEGEDGEMDNTFKM